MLENGNIAGELASEMASDAALVRGFDWRNLTDAGPWDSWREAKIRLSEALAERPPVEVGALENPSSEALAAMRQRCALVNFARYRCDPVTRGVSEASEALAGFARSLGLGASENHRSAGDFGIVALRTSAASSQAGYIPYTTRPMNWHTDGYYNPGARPVLSFILHCHSQAESGGANQIADAELAYMRLREADPRFIEALMHPRAMTIPENREPDGSLRPDSVGPVFFPDPVSGRLQMRYTARTRSIEWRDDPLTREATACLTEWLGSGDPLIVNLRMQPGEGLLNNNVLHNRTGFQDGGETDRGTRIILRVRFHERLNED